ncbi:MAG TPA: TIGR04141 family sporadically distributed protein [Thermoanaerobacterales bacterium]|nr:TIGR04141 family sporadically distributed protein [Thermoanaerobacterales bacterium]
MQVIIAILQVIFDRHIGYVYYNNIGDNMDLGKKIEQLRKITDDGEFELNTTKNYEIVFAIISKESNELPNIPFFSKISFCRIRDKLKMYGYKCIIKAILKER